MDSDTNRTRRLRDGDGVVLERENGERLRGLVVGVEADGVDVVARGDIAPGELLQISRTVRDDARYVATMEVVRAATGRSRVRMVGEWQRLQMREFVRVSVYGIVMGVRREDPPVPRDPRERKLRGREPEHHLPPRLLDISAGGLRFESRERMETGETLELEFSLPAKGPVVVRAEIVRASLAPEPAPGGIQGAHHYGVRFFRMDESVRVTIMAWVFAEQARRFREAKDEPVA